MYRNLMKFVLPDSVSGGLISSLGMLLCSISRWLYPLLRSMRNDKGRGSDRGRVLAHHRERDGHPGCFPSPLRCLFRKDLFKVDKAALQDVDLCHIFTPVELPKLEHTAVIPQHDLYRLLTWANDPIFPDPSFLIQSQLDKPVMPLCGG